MHAADIHRYGRRGVVDREVDAMRRRIVAERRDQIGHIAAHHEAIEVTADWWRDQYRRIEHEVIVRWGYDA